MPSLTIDISFPVAAIYNLKSEGGAKMQGNAKVEVIHAK